MYKAIALLKAKAGLSREAFIEYYETCHVPLIMECQPQMCNYVRNYVDLSEAILGSESGPVDFDVITELWYPDRAAYEAAMAHYARPEICARIVGDEEKFLDRSRTRFFVVVEQTTVF